MKMLWINKSKVAYRYLPFPYFVSTAVMWSLEFLQKTGWNWKEWARGWSGCCAYQEKKTACLLNAAARAYLGRVQARLWY